MKDKKMADPKASQEIHNSETHPTIPAADGVLFLDLRKNDSERIHIRVRDYRGHARIDLRVWYHADDGELKPSHKGLTIRPDQVPEIVRGLMLASMAFDPKGNA